MSPASTATPAPAFSTSAPVSDDASLHTITGMLDAQYSTTFDGNVGGATPETVTATPTCVDCRMRLYSGRGSARANVVLARPSLSANPVSAVLAGPSPTISKSIGSISSWSLRAARNSDSRDRPAASWPPKITVKRSRFVTCSAVPGGASEAHGGTMMDGVLMFG